MRKLLILATLLVCACTSIKEVKEGDGHYTDVTLDVSVGDIASKTAYTVQGNALKCEWSAGDSISVISLRGGKVACVDLFTTQAGGRTASFSGRFTGNVTDPAVCVYPALKGNSKDGYCSENFSVKLGESAISFSRNMVHEFGQTGNDSYAHVGATDLMTGVADLSQQGGSVTLTKHTALLKVTVSIPALTSTEKLYSLSLSLDGGTPFAVGSATLPLASPAGEWTTSSPVDSVSLKLGTIELGIYSGFTCPSKTLVAWIPVFPYAGDKALQGDSERTLKVTVTGNDYLYVATKTIPAKSGSSYEYPLEGGSLCSITATATKSGLADPELYRWVNTVNSVADVDVEAARLKNVILNTESRYNATGKIYYVSNDGDDSNNGLSPAAPFKTLNKINSLNLQRGDAVLFRRGDLWRGHIVVRDGTIFSAYGSGPKPKLYASPYDAAVTGEWTETSTPNVWRYSNTVEKDAGTLVFNNGDAGCAYKVLVKRDYQDNTYHIDTGEPFNGYQDLHRDLDMYHDLDTGYIYLCSTAGNPATRFNSIEILASVYVFTINNCGCVIDNLCIKYAGAHAIGAAGQVKDLTVTNCELGWIGGGLHFKSTAPTSPGTFNRDTRYGNAIEIWGSCEYYYVDHNWIYQVFDAGVTHQFSADYAYYMDNVTYSNNLIEYCVYPIEYWLSVPENLVEQSGMRNFLIRGNILRLAGEYCWGIQRANKETPAAIKTWNNKNRSVNFKMESNIIDRAKPTLLNIIAGKPEWLPECRANVYLQEYGVDIGTMVESNPKLIYVQP